MFPYGVAGLPPRRKLEAQMYVTGDPPAGDVQVTNLVTSVARGFFCAFCSKAKQQSILVRFCFFSLFLQKIHHFHSLHL